MGHGEAPSRSAPAGGRPAPDPSVPAVSCALQPFPAQDPDDEEDRAVSRLVIPDFSPDDKQIWIECGGSLILSCTADVPPPPPLCVGDPQLGVAGGGGCQNFSGGVEGKAIRSGIGSDWGRREVLLAQLVPKWTGVMKRDGHRPQTDETAGSRPSVQPPSDALVQVLQAVAPRADPAKLARDIESLPGLALEGFAGPLWRERQGELLAYVAATLPRKIITGEIFGLMVKAGIPRAGDLSLPRGGISEEEARDLAIDVGLAALERFREILMTKYDPFRENPACIETYFFGCCLLHFRGLWRRWLTQYRRRALELEVGRRAQAEWPVQGEDPEWRAITLVEAQRGLHSLKPSYRASAALDAMGFTGPQSARRQGTTPKTVEGRLKGARAQFEQLRENSESAA